MTTKEIAPRVLVLIQKHPKGITNGDIRERLEVEDKLPAGHAGYMRPIDRALQSLKKAGSIRVERVNGFPHWFATG